MQPCVRHSEVRAQFHCDACKRYLCAQCAEESHALFICAFCGERALPLGGGAEQTPTQRRQAAQVAKPYSFKDALTYPIRDSAGYFTMVGMVIILALAALAGACFTGIIFRAILSLAIAGMQFKIVRKTMDGDYGVPYWTDWDYGELLLDWLAWMVVGALQWGLIVLVALDRGLFDILFSEPSLLFWLVVAGCGWVGTALALMAMGAAANYGRWNVFALPHHVVAFKRAAGDAVATTNLVFGLTALVPIVKLLVSPLPLVGTILGIAIGAYWTLVLPHLCGLLFGRNAEDMDAVYM